MERIFVSGSVEGGNDRETRGSGICLCFYFYF
jgi:hypothetical protein